ncbi:hypothetical protein WA158_002953 [Blastocystis sp. Blastoise]
MGCQGSQVFSSIPVIHVYFGTQTGTSEEFSKTFKQHADDNGFKCEVIDLEDFDEEQLKTIEFGLFFMSSYGNGEPTDNAQEFFDWLKENKAEKDILPNLTYSVFGLGDHYYPKYNIIGKTTDLILGKIGGKQFMPISLGDAADDIESDFDKWEKQFWPKFISTYSTEVPVAAQKPANLSLHYILKSADAPITETYIKKVDLNTVDSKYQPFYTSLNVPITENKELCTGEHAKSIHHVTVTLPEGASYNCAGTVSVFPENEDSIVETLAKSQNYDLDSIFHLVPIKDDATISHLFPTPCRVRICLSRYLDIAGICPLSFIKIMALFAENEQERSKLEYLVSDAGNDEYKTQIVANKMTITQMLLQYESVNIPLETFVQTCPIIVPREYSISSDPILDKNELHYYINIYIFVFIIYLYSYLFLYLTVGRLVEQTNIYTYKGLCSNYICDKQIGKKMRIHIHESRFIYPENKDIPMILISVGSGIAPIRSILRHRSTLPLEKQNITAVFYGCRSVKEDYIYREELEGYSHEEDLLSIAFSRDQEKKIYVNDKIMEHEEKVYDLMMNKHAILYLCGSKSMGNTVMNALKSIIAKGSNVNEEQASILFNKLSEDQKLFLELW